MRKLAIVPVLMLAACGTSAPTLSGKTGLHVADVALANGAPSSALQIARTALEANPRNVEALLRVGEASYALGQAGQASDAFRKALAIEPHLPRAQLGIARIELGSDPAAAEADLHRALQREPSNVAMLTDLGVAQDLQGRHKDAQTTYHTALGIEPGLTSAQVDLGLSLALSGQATDAVQMLQPIGQSPSSTPKVRQDLATALALAGDARSASDILQVDLSHEQTVAALSGLAALHDTLP